MSYNGYSYSPYYSLPPNQQPGHQSSANYPSPPTRGAPYNHSPLGAVTTENQTERLPFATQRTPSQGYDTYQNQGNAYSNGTGYTPDSSVANGNGNAREMSEARRRSSQDLDTSAMGSLAYVAGLGETAGVTRPSQSNSNDGRFQSQQVQYGHTSYDHEYEDGRSASPQTNVSSNSYQNYGVYRRPTEVNWSSNQYATLPSTQAQGNAALAASAFEQIQRNHSRVSSQNGQTFHAHPQLYQPSSREQATTVDRQASRTPTSRQPKAWAPNSLDRNQPSSSSNRQDGESATWKTSNQAKQSYGNSDARASLILQQKVHATDPNAITRVLNDVRETHSHTSTNIAQAAPAPTRAASNFSTRPPEYAVSAISHAQHPASPKGSLRYALDSQSQPYSLPSIEPQPTTIDPNQIFDQQEYERRKAAAEAKVEAAKKAAQEKRQQALEKARQEQEGTRKEEQKAMQEKQKVSSRPSQQDTDALNGSAHHTIMSPTNSTIPNGETSSDKGSKEEIEAEMLAMLEKMREYRAKDPALFSQVWEQVKKVQPPGQSSSPAPASQISRPAAPADPAPRRLANGSMLTFKPWDQMTELEQDELRASWSYMTHGEQYRYARPRNGDRMEGLVPTRDYPQTENNNTRPKLPDLGRYPAFRMERWHRPGLGDFAHLKPASEMKKSRGSKRKSTQSAASKVPSTGLATPNSSSIVELQHTNTSKNVGGPSEIPNMDPDTQNMRQTMQTLPSNGSGPFSLLDEVDSATSSRGTPGRHQEVNAMPQNARPTSNATIWPENRKTSLAVAAQKALMSDKANAGKAIWAHDIQGLLDQNPTYVQLCEALVSKGFVVDRAAFAKFLLPVVSSDKDKVSQQPTAQPKEGAPRARGQPAVQAGVNANNSTPKRRGRLRKSDQEPKEDMAISNFVAEPAKTANIVEAPQSNRVISNTANSEQAPHTNAGHTVPGAPPRDTFHPWVDNFKPPDLPQQRSRFFPQLPSGQVEKSKSSNNFEHNNNILESQSDNTYKSINGVIDKTRSFAVPASSGPVHGTSTLAPYSNSGFGMLVTSGPNGPSEPPNKFRLAQQELPASGVSTSSTALPSLNWAEEGSNRFRSLATGSPPKRDRPGRPSRAEAPRYHMNGSLSAPTERSSPNIIGALERGPPNSALNTLSTNPRTKENMARKRDFNDIVDLTGEMEDESTYRMKRARLEELKSQTDYSYPVGFYDAGMEISDHLAPKSLRLAPILHDGGSNKQRLSTHKQVVSPKGQTINATKITTSLQQFKHMPTDAIGQRELLRTEIACKLIDKKRAARRKTIFNPNTIARDILISTGRHPSERPLNAHLDVLRTNFTGVNLESDLSTFPFELVDPSPTSVPDLEAHGENDADDEDDDMPEPLYDPFLSTIRQLQPQMARLSNGDVQMLDAPPVGLMKPSGPHRSRGSRKTRLSNGERQPVNTAPRDTGIANGSRIPSGPTRGAFNGPGRQVPSSNATSLSGQTSTGQVPASVAGSFGNTSTAPNSQRAPGLNNFTGDTVDLSRIGPGVPTAEPHRMSSSSAIQVAVPSPVAKTPEIPKKRIGRPPKVKQAGEATKSDSAPSDQGSTGKKRGRPRKEGEDEGEQTFKSQEPTASTLSTPVVKKRGRPVGWRKNPNAGPSTSPSSSARVEMPTRTRPSGTPSRPSQLRRTVAVDDGIAIQIPSRSSSAAGHYVRTLEEIDISPERKRRPQEVPTSRPQSPPYSIFPCRWEGCVAELHNLVTLRKHLQKVHCNKKTAHGKYKCLWHNCNTSGSPPSKGPSRSPKQFITETALKEHVDRRHLTELGWELGDGPSSQPSGQSIDLYSNLPVKEEERETRRRLP